jgi:NodT family efflux transporter outer membrane factor (OMF) lipoprotein
LRIKIARSNAKIQKRSFEITEKLYQGGEKSELDLQQAKTQYMATLSSIPSLEIQKTQLRNGLCLLAGRAPGDLPELTEAPLPLPELNPVVIHEIPAALLLRRPDVRAAAFQVAAQSAQVGIAEAGRYPSISLLGTLGWSGTTVGGSPETLALGIGPAFTWNIFDYGRTKNSVRIQDARLQQAIVNFQNTVIEAAGEIDDASISVVKTKEQKEPQRLSTEAANRALELANARYREGYADFQRVIEAQRSAAAQADRELVNESSHISSVIQLCKALGGGWSATPIEQLISAETRETMQARTDWGDLLTTPLPAPTPLNGKIEGESHE